MALREVVALLGYKVDKRSESRVQGSMKNVLGSVKGLVASFGLIFGATEIVRGFSSMINLASDASESLNQLNAIFGETAGTVADGMNRIAKETGRSEFEMTKFGATMGALLKPLLGSNDAAAAMSEKVVALTADMSSFFNITQQQALEKFRAGLIGSSEPLISLGIDVREAALAQFALSKGITKSTKDMKTAEKTALRFELISSKLGETGAIGDAARTSREGANAFRAIGQAMKDFGTRIGQFLLPMATRSANAMTDLVRSLDESIRSGGKASRIMEFFVNVLSAFGTALDFAFEKAKKFAIPLGIILALLFPATTLFLALGAAILLVAEDLEVMGQGGNSVIGTLIEGFQRLRDETGSVFGAISEMIETAVQFWADQFGIGEDAGAKFDRILADIRSDFERIVAIGRTVGDIFGAVGTGGILELGQAVTSAPSAVGSTLINQPSANVEIVVNAAENPEATGASVADQVSAVMGQQFREAKNFLTTIGS
jgi:hypothetical protein